MNRNVADLPQGTSSAHAPAPATEGSEVDMSDSFEPPPTQSVKPAPTVMFDSESPMAAMLAKPGSSSPGPEPSASEPSEEEGQAGDEDTGTRPVRSKSKGRPLPKKGQRRSPTPRKWGSAGTDEEEVAKEAQPSSKKGILIAAVVAAVIVVAVVAFLVLRGGKETSTGEKAKPAEPPPVKAEPAAEPPPLAKPAPEPAAEPEKPTVAEKAAAGRPSPAEKAPAEEKPAAEKPGHAARPERPEHAAHEEKPASEKGKPAAGESAPAASEPKSNGEKPSEADYQRANDAYQRGNAKLFKGDMPGAIADFSQALKLNPRDPAIHRGLGLAYAQSGNSAEAIKHLKAYLKAAPKANDRSAIERRIRELHGK